MKIEHSSICTTGGCSSPLLCGICTTTHGGGLPQLKSPLLIGIDGEWLHRMPK